MSEKENHTTPPEPSKPIKRRLVRMGKSWSTLMRDMASLGATPHQSTDFVLHRVIEDGLESEEE